MRIYNLFPLLAGRFSQWTPHLERAAAMGFDWIFVNPIQQAGRSGSLYSIKDYFCINPAFLEAQPSAEEQVKAMIRAANGLGMKVMVDLVINHCAYDSPLPCAHPEWFVRENGQIAHPSCDQDGQRVVWEDLAQFDFTQGRSVRHWCAIASKSSASCAGWASTGSVATRLTSCRRKSGSA
jgi:starch synthase (maltosyl-transferring)